VSEFEGFDETIFWDLIGGAFNHQHILLIADVNEVEGRAEHLLDRGIGDELTVDLCDANRSDRPVPRDVRNRECSAGAVHHGDVGLIDLVSREQLTDDLHFIQEAFREERTAWPIAQTGSENFFFGRAAFTLEITAWKAACGCVLLAIIYSKRKPVLTRLCRLSDTGSDEDIGFADSDIDCAVSELGIRAG
jgi:hypothetical protein